MNKLLFFLISMLLMSCATNIDSGSQAPRKTESKANSFIPSEDAEECNSYRSWQLDYWKDKIIVDVFTVICI